MNEESIRSALSTVNYPGFSRDIVSFGLVKEIKISGESAVVRLEIATREPDIPRQIYTAAAQAVAGLGGEVDNPLWKQKWPGRKAFDDQGKVAIKVGHDHMCSAACHCPGACAPNTRTGSGYQRNPIVERDCSCGTSGCGRGYHFFLSPGRSKS